MKPGAHSRRRWLKHSALACAWGFPAIARSLDASGTPPRYRAAIIGHTGRGGYGHDYDLIFKDVPRVTVEAVADPDDGGRATAAGRAGASRQFRDYRAMLREIQPDLVCIATRHPDQHLEMALAAMEVCRGIFLEKPITETVSEADALLAQAARRNVKIQVAHTRRTTRHFVRVRALLAEGFLGTVREIQIHGKQDRRAGGEDLLVLGSHDFDLLRFYFGDPRWCQAHVGVGGRDATLADVRRGQEPVRVWGDTIHALFGFANNLVARWSSVTTADAWAAPPRPSERWSFEIHGTRRILAYQSGAADFAYLDSPHLLQLETGLTWQPLPEPQAWEWPEHARHPIRSLLHAIETGSEPVCSGADGRWAVEMVTAVYASHRSRARVDLPLRDRSDPLA